jgi:hypothetical protein
MAMRRIRWGCCARAPHLGREKQTAASDQSNELSPFYVEHGDFLPYLPISEPTGPFPSVYRTLSLPQSGGLGPLSDGCQFFRKANRRRRSRRGAGGWVKSIQRCKSDR